MNSEIFLEFMENVRNRAERMLEVLMFAATIFSFFMVTLLLKIELIQIGVPKEKIAIPMVIIQLFELIFLGMILLWAISTSILVIVKDLQKRKEKEVEQ